MIYIIRKDNPIVGDKYNELITTMLTCAKTNHLPQMLEINDISNITLNDIHSLIVKFTNDTGLEMKMSAEICPYCDRLHVFLFVDYPDIEDDKIPLQ